MNATAITTNNSGVRNVPPGARLPDAVNALADFIVLGTDGGRFKVKGRDEPVESVWKVISGADIARLPQEALRNMTFGGGNHFAVDGQGILHLYVQVSSPDFDDLMKAIENTGVGILGDRVSFERTMRQDETLVERVPDLYSSMRRVPRDDGFKLLDRIRAHMLRPQQPSSEGPTL